MTTADVASEHPSVISTMITVVTGSFASAPNHTLLEWGEEEVPRSYEEAGVLETADGNYTLPGGPLAKIPEIGFIITAVLVTLIMIVIVVGNMLVCIAIATEKSLKTTQNWFIASLAVSDFLIGLVIMPFSLARELMGYWIFGEIWCDIHAALDVLICTASINNLCLISLDRYWSVTHAVEYLRKRTASRAVVMICGVWLLSALISLPPLIGWRKMSDQKNSLPQCSVSEDLGYVLYSALGSFYIPAVVMVFVYIKIFLAARKRARRAMERKKTLAARNKAAIAAQQPLGTQHSVESACENNSLRRRGGDKKFSPPPIVIVNTEAEEGSPESDGSSPLISPDVDTMGASAVEAEHSHHREQLLLRREPRELTQLAQAHASSNINKLALQHQEQLEKARLLAKQQQTQGTGGIITNPQATMTSAMGLLQQQQDPVDSMKISVAVRAGNGGGPVVYCGGTGGVAGVGGGNNNGSVTTGRVRIAGGALTNVVENPNTGGHATSVGSAATSGTINLDCASAAGISAASVDGNGDTLLFCAGSDAGVGVDGAGVSSSCGVAGIGSAVVNGAAGVSDTTVMKQNNKNNNIRNQHSNCYQTNNTLAAGREEGAASATTGIATTNNATNSNASSSNNMNVTKTSTPNVTTVPSLTICAPVTLTASSVEPDSLRPQAVRHSDACGSEMSPNSVTRKEGDDEGYIREPTETLIVDTYNTADPRGLGGTGDSISEVMMAATSNNNMDGNGSCNASATTIVGADIGKMHNPVPSTLQHQQFATSHMNNSNNRGHEHGVHGHKLSISVSILFYRLNHKRNKKYNVRCYRFSHTL